MRFSAEDRRQLARRIKNRLPAALTSIRLRRIPQLMLVISATVFLTPEAKAKIEANEVTPVFTKIYSKEELQKKLPPNPVSNLGDRILAEVEPALLRAVLAATSGNQLRAADLLGINRNTLRVKLRDRQVKVVRGLS